MARLAASLGQRAGQVVVRAPVGKGWRFWCGGGDYRRWRGSLKETELVDVSVILRER